MKETAGFSRYQESIFTRGGVRSNSCFRQSCFAQGEQEGRGTAIQRVPWRAAASQLRKMHPRRPLLYHISHKYIHTSHSSAVRCGGASGAYGSRQSPAKYQHIACGTGVGTSQEISPTSTTRVVSVEIFPGQRL